MNILTLIAYWYYRVLIMLEYFYIGLEPILLLNSLKSFDLVCNTNCGLHHSYVIQFVESACFKVSVRLQSLNKNWLTYAHTNILLKLKRKHSIPSICNLGNYLSLIIQFQYAKNICRVAMHNPSSLQTYTITK